jgi:hypothetical protein
MRTHLLIVATLLTLISTQTATSCTRGAFTFGGRNFLNAVNICKGATAGDESTTSHELFLKSTTTWADGLTWTFNAKQTNAANNFPVYAGPNTVNLRWNKLDANNYIVAFQNSIPAGTNSVVIVLKASDNYSTYRFDCINAYNPTGTFNVKGVNSENNDLIHMSVYLAQNPTCGTTFVESPGCAATIASLRDEVQTITDANNTLDSANTILDGQIDTCDTNVQTQIDRAELLSTQNQDLQDHIDEAQDDLDDMTVAYNSCVDENVILNGQAGVLNTKATCKQDNISALEEYFNLFLQNNENCNVEPVVGGDN